MHGAAAALRIHHPVNTGQKHTVPPAAGALVADNSEVIVEAAVAGAGITFAPDWLVGTALRAEKLTEILTG